MTLGVSSNNTASDVQDAQSVVGMPVHFTGGSGPCLREPPIFIGKTLKEARDFICLLIVNFVLLSQKYLIPASYVLYSVMFLGSELAET